MQQSQRPQLSGMSIKRIAREAASLGITVDELVDRALLALADEVDAERSKSVPRQSVQYV
jgi:hypothetical protein